MDSLDAWDEELYFLYPRKVGKRAAMKAIRNARTRLHDGEYRVPMDWPEVQALLVTKAKQYAASPAGNRDSLTPHPATFYNQSRYLDAEVEWYRLSPEEEKQMRTRAMANIGVYTPQ